MLSLKLLQRRKMKKQKGNPVNPVNPVNKIKAKVAKEETHSKSTIKTQRETSNSYGPFHRVRERSKQSKPR